MNLETIKVFEVYRTNWKKYSKEIKAELNDTEVYVFGSVIKGNTHPASDIDILLVSESFIDIKTRIKTHANLKLKYLDAPFEFHLIEPDKFPLYKKMIKELVKI